jgi:hypothetical protein
MQLLQQASRFFGSFGPDPDLYFFGARTWLPHSGFP